MKLTSSMAVVLAAVVPTVAVADNGYFQIGHGAESMAVAGAAAASTRDAFGGASNPATTVWVGNQVQGSIGVTSGGTRFSRQSGLPQPFSGLLDTNPESDVLALLGEFAFSRKLAPDLSFSVVGYSNGAKVDLPGDNTVCPAPPPAPAGTTFSGNALCGAGKIVTTLKQFTLAPTISKQLSENLSVGGSLLIVGQMFTASGLQGLTAQSAAPESVTDKGTDYAYGVGFRVGGY